MINPSVLTVLDPHDEQSELSVCHFHGSLESGME